MTDDPRHRPVPPAQPAAPAATRQDRAAEALRANLLKRKAQMRARRAQDRPIPDPAGPDDGAR